MSRTISGSTSLGITLVSGNNPVTVNGTINANVRSGYALYAPGAAAADWTITNSGTIENTNSYRTTALQIGKNGNPAAQGMVTNLSGGRIYGAGGGVAVFANTGSISNASGGTIEAGGFTAASIYGQKGTITNAGVILAPDILAGNNSEGNGASIYDGGLILNLANATISGARGGVDLNGYGPSVGVYNPNNAVYGATLNNYGTISGGGLGGAVAFYDSTPLNRVIDHPGAVFKGGTYGGAYNDVSGGGGTLELSTGTGTGTVSGFGTNFAGFQSLQFDPLARWKVIGNTSASSLGGVTITGFNSYDTIELTGFVATKASFSNNLLTLTNASSLTTTLHVQGNFVSGDFHVSTYNGTGTTLLDCFALGTNIATPAGEARVEELLVGDVVRTHFTGQAPIQWIGRRHVDCARHPEPRDVWPVRVTAGAFGPGLPARDLLLSPNHAIHIQDVLIPVRLLANGTTITQVPIDQITYFHLELSQHDLLRAEGILAESYIAAGDRSNFTNGGDVVRAHPDFATHRGNVAAVWETRGCAPLVLHGTRLDKAREWVNRRATRDVRRSVAA